MRGQPFEVSTRYLGLADKSARTVATLTETLNRHRGKGQQTDVTVNGGQAIVPLSKLCAIGSGARR